MKNYTSILVIMLLLLLGACSQDDELAPNGRVDLTRNGTFTPRWVFEVAILDSLDDNKQPYFGGASPSSREFFGLKSLNKENTVYLRTTEYEDPSGIVYCYDTIEVQTHNNDSIVCKIARYAKNDTIVYSDYTFHGKYNKLSGNIEGYVFPKTSSYRCQTCPGKFYIYYTGNTPAVFLPY